jgi:hypothetical protein
VLDELEEPALDEPEELPESEVLFDSLDPFASPEPDDSPEPEPEPDDDSDEDDTFSDEPDPRASLR